MSIKLGRYLTYEPAFIKLISPTSKTVPTFRPPLLMHSTHSSRLGTRLIVLLPTFSVLLAAFQQSSIAEEPVEPLLQKYCLGCHNRQDAEVGLSLQTFEAIKKGSDSGPILKPTAPMESLLYQVLLTDVDNTMPPSDEAQPTPAERTRLQQWALSGGNVQSMAAGIPDVPEIRPFAHQKSQAFSSVAISAARLAVGGSRQISIHDAITGKQQQQFAVAEGNVTSLAWAKKSKLLLAAVGLPGVNGVALLLDPDSGQVRRQFSGHTDAVYCAVMNPEETVVATAGYDRRILIHDIATGKILKTMTGHHGSIFQLAFDKTGAVLCSASTDGTVKVWNIKTGERLDTLSQAEGEQYCVQVAQNSATVFAAGEDNRIRVWDLVSNNTAAINPLRSSLFAHEQTIHQMQLSPDETKLATAAEDGTVRVWNTQTMQQLQALPIQKSMVTSLAFASNKLLTVTTLNGNSQAFPVISATDSIDGSDTALSAFNPTSTMLKPASASANSAQLPQTSESEPNNEADTAEQIAVPSIVLGRIHRPESLSDSDCYVFEAVAGQNLVLEINAARNKSPLDSKIEILSEAGQPLLRTQLQAVRDSWFTFRGKDGDQSGDFRLFNWREMELNQFLYADGEVTKLHHYPRGPDSGFNVYPGFGKRHTYFGTTGTSHALLAPAFIVEAHSPTAKLVANGLPIFPLYFENDDDGLREFGADSRLFFDVPTTGRYVVRISDARDFSGEDFHYEFTIRKSQPAFTVSHNGSKFSVSKGAGKEIEFKAKRLDGYKGPITIKAEGLPPGYICSAPVTIQQEQYRAYATIFATDAAVQITDEQLKAIRFTAEAKQADGVKKIVEVPSITEFKLLSSPKLKVAIHTFLPDSSADGDVKEQRMDATESVVLSIRPGQTINAFLTLDRLKHEGVVSFGKEDAGRNLPFGVFVDNIGLNGLLLLEGQSEREFYITASPVAEPGTYPFHLKSNVNGVTSYPATLVVEPAQTEMSSENEIAD